MSSPTPTPDPGPGGSGDTGGPAPAPPAPTTATGSPVSGQPTPEPEATAAVQTALRTEHAAVWSYGLIAAFLPASLDPRAKEDLAAHRARRDATMRLLADSGVPSVAAEPAYRTPNPVTDQESAMRLAVAAEADSAAAWEAVLGSCDDQGLRHAALDGLSDAAVRGGRWSEQLGESPPVPPFPGHT